MHKSSIELQGNIANTVLSDAVFRPMLYSTLMVQSILEGLKTETRRIMNPQPIDNTEIDGNFFEGNHKGYVKVDGHKNWKEQFIWEFSKYNVGEIIWVRETFRKIEQDFGKPRYEYKATETINLIDKWKPSLFMPKDACRLFLEITNIRFERLNEISKEDAINEGIQPLLMSRMQQIQSSQLYRNYLSKPELFNDGLSAINSYKSLWQKINGQNSWSENPWVWVYTFKVVECPYGFR